MMINKDRGEGKPTCLNRAKLWYTELHVVVSRDLLADVARALKGACPVYAESWVGGMSIGRCWILGEATDLRGSRQKGTMPATAGKEANNGVGQSTREA